MFFVSGGGEMRWGGRKGNVLFQVCVLDFETRGHHAVDEMNNDVIAIAIGSVSTHDW